MSQAPSRLITACGPIAAEERLLEIVDELRPRAPRDLHPPLRIVVPSRSLRLHVASRIIARGDRAVAGVIVQSLQGAALEILETAGVAVPRGDTAFEVLVRRLGALEPALVEDLSGLSDGYGATVAAVRDLLDAGFSAEIEDAVLEKLTELRGVLASGCLRRVAGVVRVASRVAEGLDVLDAHRRSHLMRLACDVLAVRGPSALSSRAVLIHGFADATGLATELLQTLMKVLGGALILDRPPDPSLPGRDDAGCVFLERFAGHFGGLEVVRHSEFARVTTVDGFVAPSLDAEIRNVAHRIRALLDGGQVPEEIGVAAREPARVANLIRRHFGRLGVPFSGAATVVPGGGVRRRVGLLGQLLQTRERTAIEVWVEASGTRSDDLALGLRMAGISRLDEMAQLEDAVVGDRGIPLPVGGMDENGFAVRRRLLPVQAVRSAVRRAGELLTCLSGWPEKDTVAVHHERTRAAVRDLGWDGEELRAVDERIAAIAAEVPPGWVLSRDEWVREVQRGLRAVGEMALGGSGGGVQVLSVMEARARTFAHLFLVDVVRGVFPRVVHEDFLIPDAVRGHLASDVLPEMPVKARGTDEERYLFAQVTASAPRLNLSWSAASDGGTHAASPFVERMVARGVFMADPVGTAWDSPDLRPRHPFEHAVLSAAGAPRSLVEAVLGQALADTADGSGSLSAGLEPALIAAARLDVIAEREREPGGADPGPWAGVGGAGAGDGLWVTTLEDLATCPLRSLVTRRLGIARVPDPEGELPDTRGLLVGKLVHEVLERIVRDAIGGGAQELGAVSASGARRVEWPDEDRLRGTVSELAERLAREEGLASLHMASLLAAQAMPFLAVAGEVAWRKGERAPLVVAAELTGEVEATGEIPALRFRVDRVDVDDDGELLAVDYKTGGMFSRHVKESTRRGKLLMRIASGRTLQAVAYALGCGSEGARGRYVYLQPDIGNAPADARSQEVRAGDREAVEAFRTAVRVICDASRAGVCFPRVEAAVRGSLAPACDHCAVAEACLRDDSAVRRRVVAWMQAEGVADAGPAAAARALWWLGCQPQQEEE